MVDGTFCQHKVWSESSCQRAISRPLLFDTMKSGNGDFEGLSDYYMKRFHYSHSLCHRINYVVLLGTQCTLCSDLINFIKQIRKTN